MDTKIDPMLDPVLGEVLVVSWHHLGGILGRFGVSFGRLGPSWGGLGLSWGCVWFWGRLGCVSKVSWRRLRGVLGRLRVSFWMFCEQLGLFRARSYPRASLIELRSGVARDMCF